LAPGKFFLAQKGSGQAIFVGIADDHYLATSEVYGFAEETPAYIKLDGETVVEGKKGQTQGQIFILDQDSSGGMGGLSTMFYDGTPVEIDEKDVKHTEITSRDIDRQEFPHYFMKEISESPVSVEKTLQNRWKIKEDDKGQYVITLPEKTFPDSLQAAFLDGQIRRIFFVGQGTAGVAALACANILNYYLGDPSIYISAIRASELSGFVMSEHDVASSMSDTLVVAISQSGTTTDTNRAVDMVRERGAHTLGIVNRRDSDITFKVDGVMYTSSGRDIEMSVASTKAFYSQIVAGALLGLHMAALKQNRTDEFIAAEILQLINLPAHMRRILKIKDKIEASAKRLAITRTYWAAVGSGPNKASADEIRIKLSELCYKTISTDYVEDKKHIDLSSEPLIIVCAAGSRPTVIGDIIKDTAIFRAHKALPIVIADEGENRFAPYAEDVFHVPIVSEHLAPIVNTLVGHIWGYYAALAIDEGSRFFYNFREGIQSTIDDYAKTGSDIIELVQEKSFREKIVRFYEEFRKKKTSNRLSMAMGLELVSNITLLLKYLAGKLPVPDFELDFGKKGTARNMLDTLFECISDAIDCMARPVDAIKHQAKTVTVGTSRIREKVEGILFDALNSYHISISQLTNSNIIVIRNLQNVVANIQGAIFYRIDNLNLLGEPTDETTIEVIQKDGVLKPIPSRVENDTRLKGTKRIIVREGNVYIGKGRKDNRSILVIPIISASPSAPNLIEYLLLLNISFKERIPLETKIKALGGKFERIKNIVQENSIVWEDNYLELCETENLFGLSAEKIGDSIVSRLL
jgi:glucosamine--fructose-6-phosphate aminotransferase (isomerizing)